MDKQNVENYINHKKRATKMTKILITDDSAFMRKILRNILTKLGYKEIIEAANGNECIEKLSTDKPDLAFLDIIMPDIDGVDVLRELKKVSPKTKVIMATAVGQEAKIEACKRLGAIAYIVKPFDEEKLTAAITKALK